nr:importin subunit beta-1-like [Tanacetum cinerariifolium]
MKFLGGQIYGRGCIKVQDIDKPKGNNVVGPSVVNIVEHNNSIRLNYVVICTRISKPLFRRAIETSSDRSDVFMRVQKLDRLIKDVKELCPFGRVQTVNKISCFGDVALAIGEHFDKYVPYAMPMMQGAVEVCAQVYGSIPAPCVD